MLPINTKHNHESFTMSKWCCLANYDIEKCNEIIRDISSEWFKCKETDKKTKEISSFCDRSKTKNIKMKEESNAAMDACMKDWEDLSAEYLVRVLDATGFS